MVFHSARASAGVSASVLVRRMVWVQARRSAAVRAIVTLVVALVAVLAMCSRSRARRAHSLRVLMILTEYGRMLHPRAVGPCACHIQEGADLKLDAVLVGQAAGAVK